MKQVIYFCIITLAIIIAMYVLRLRETYLNAGGQKRAILLAEVVGKYRINNTCIPNEFLSDLDSAGLLSDARGVKISINPSNDIGFEITYKPVISFYSMGNKRNQTLHIKWNPDTKSTDITTTINRP